MAKKNGNQAIVKTELTDDQIKEMLAKYQAEIEATPNYKPPTTREESLALLDKMISDATPGNNAPEGATPAAASIVDAAKAGGVLDPNNTSPAEIPDESKPPVLSRAGKSLEWTDLSGGKSAFEVEMSRTGGHWEVEATLVAGTNTYSPRDHGGTGFYRIRMISPDGALRAAATSNVVLIHFN